MRLNKAKSNASNNARYNNWLLSNNLTPIILTIIILSFVTASYFFSIQNIKFEKTLTGMLLSNVNVSIENMFRLDANVAALGSADDINSGGVVSYPYSTKKFGPNLLVNGGFEDVNFADGETKGWVLSNVFSVDQNVSKTGLSSLSLNNAKLYSKANLTKQQVFLNKGVYYISGWVKLNGTFRGRNGVKFGLRTIGGSYLGITSAIGKKSDWQFIEIKNIAVSKNTTAYFAVTPYYEPNLTVWFDDFELREELPKKSFKLLPLDIFMLYPNYRGILFDDQSQIIKFDVTTNVPQGAYIEDYQIRAKVIDEFNKVDVEQKTFPAAAHFTADFDGTHLINGNSYLVKFHLVRLRDNSIFFEFPDYRIYKVQGAERNLMTMSFDENNRFLVNNKPTFIIGFYDTANGFRNTESAWSSLFNGSRKIFELPINFYLNTKYGRAQKKSMATMMDALQKHNILYLQTGNCFRNEYSGRFFPINANDEYTFSLASKSNFAGIYAMEQCNLKLAPIVFEKYQRIKNLDPDGVTLGITTQSQDIQYWRNSVDVIGVDAYPLNSTKTKKDFNLNKVAEWNKQTNSMLKSSRPFIAIIQFSQQVSKDLWPKRDDLRNMGYMAIAEGANGIFYKGYGTGALVWSCSKNLRLRKWCSDRLEPFNILKNVTTELEGIQPVLASIDSPELLAGNSNPNIIRTRVKFFEGKGYLIAYNSLNSQISSTFTWNRTPSTITVYYESRNITPSENNFTDTFKPYQAHVYIITAEEVKIPALSAPTIAPNGTSFNNSVAINLSMTNPEAIIRYTIDGSIPNTTSQLYTAPFTLNQTATVKARAFLIGYIDSPISTAVFTKLYPVESIPLIISNGSPIGALPSNTTLVTISVTTNKNASCRYSSAEDVSYFEMLNEFLDSGGTSHSTNISNLSGGNHVYYIKCISKSGDINKNDFVISFSISQSPQSLNLIIRFPEDGTTVFNDTLKVAYQTLGNIKDADNVHLQLDNESEVKGLELDGEFLFSNISEGSHTLKGYLAKSDHSQLIGTVVLVSFATKLNATVQINDTDGDGVPDIADRCPSTKQIHKSKVNRFGCPLPRSSKFSHELTTNFIESDIKNLTKFKIGVNGRGQIGFGEQIIELLENSSEPVDLDDIIEFLQKKVILKAEKFSRLNISATITFFNLSDIENPLLLRDNTTCTDCQILDFINKSLRFAVPHFTEYSVEEGSYCGDSYCSAQESCSSCSADCGSCPAPPSSGGGSSGGGSGSSGGGGSGGSSSYPSNGGGGGSVIEPASYNLISSEKRWDSINAGASATLKINRENLTLTQVTMEMKNAVINAELKIASISSNPYSTPASSKVYQYLQLTKTNIGDADASKITISFKVPKSWLTSNNVAEGDIVLYRYSNGQWNELPTTKTGSDANDIFYESVTPGFGAFAVAGKEIIFEGRIFEKLKNETNESSQKEEPNFAELQETNQKATTKQEPKISLDKSLRTILPLLVFIALIILIAVSIKKFRKRQIAKLKVK